ncbi:Os02g0612600 [Oryza sativa Japonica Group]|uniref:Os02g0612600 protein n=1 Tax=Oryza sativa subsp. japonica TaxID=39947 RepID=Q6K626_ORYSJ|nr:unknown protein [Oryza sativa Japonica Group]BAF09327.1 Os02g0612600 [Oryza sativa Japonica Group]|eukprot:NP_001047413.1 Os02g0612600 [Oryza sativa Japonica Group]
MEREKRPLPTTPFLPSVNARASLLSRQPLRATSLPPATVRDSFPAGRRSRLLSYPWLLSSCRPALASPLPPRRGR